MRTAKISSLGVVSSLLLILAAGVFVMSQDLAKVSVSRVKVQTASLAGVTLAPYDPETYAQFTEFLLHHPAEAGLSPFSAILQNGSGKAIVELTLVWTWTDPAGQNHTTESHTDGLFPTIRPVVAKGDALLVTPDFVLARSMLDSGFILPVAGSMSRDAAELGRCSNVAVEVDTVIFEDGLVAGPDRTGTLAYLQAR